MVWAYVWAVVFLGKRQEKISVPAVLILGVLPDVDLFLGGIGVFHHTFMHSLFFWLLIFAPFFFVFRRRTVAYFVSIAQHFAFGDFLMGSIMLFWPFSQSYFGFNISMSSMPDVAIEIAGLILAAGISYFNGDFRRMLSMDIHNVLMFVPFFGVAGINVIFCS